MKGRIGRVRFNGITNEGIFAHENNLGSNLQGTNQSERERENKQRRVVREQKRVTDVLGGKTFKMEVEGDKACLMLYRGQEGTSP